MLEADIDEKIENQYDLDKEINRIKKLYVGGDMNETYRELSSRRNELKNSKNELK